MDSETSAMALANSPAAIASNNGYHRKNATPLEAYLCTCTVPSWPLFKPRPLKCMVCNKAPRWMIWLCSSCRSPYLRDFFTTEYESKANYAEYPRPVKHYCFDCSTAEGQTILVPRQVVKTFTAEQYAKAGIAVFRIP
jgi:hypothetical protein